MSDPLILDNWHGKPGSTAVGKSPNDFERLGHPGKWVKAIPVSGAVEVNFTGSQFGAGGILISTPGQVITLSNGGTVSGSWFATGSIHELSISKVVSTSGVAQVFLRNHLVK